MDADGLEEVKVSECLENRDGSLANKSLRTS